MASQAPAASTEIKDALPEKTRVAVKRFLTFGLFQAVLMHCLALQSEVTLFSRALKGDQGAVARALARTVAAQGITGLFLNQICGSLSDSIGRKPFFLIGPVMNMVCSSLMMKKSDSLRVISIVRILKSIFITLSGSLMTQAALADICSGQELAIMSSTLQAAVGAAVIAGPYIESLLLKVSGGNPLAPYRALGYFSILQFTINTFLPETLVKAKRKAMPGALEFARKANPITFIEVFRGKNTLLKKLMITQTMQFCNDGKVTSDLFQLWSRNVLNWSADVARDFVAFWGGAVTAGGYFVQPWLLKQLSTSMYTTVGNVCVGIGLCIHGLAIKGSCMWAGVPFLIPGVNSGSSNAMKALAQKVADDEGYGKGEYSAWSNNLRALAQSVQTLLIGQWYSLCQAHGVYLGSTWWYAGFVGGWLPQLMMMTIPTSVLDQPLS